MEKLDWRDYFERLQPKQQIFQAEAEYFVAKLEEAIPLSDNWRILDFGCGFGFTARALAPKVSRVYAWDIAENMRDHAKRNTADLDGVVCPNRLPDHVNFDLILVNSVVQYMTIEELGEWLSRWAVLLWPAGRIVISDIIPEKINPLLDMASLLLFSLHRGFLLQAVVDGLNEVGRYTHTRNKHPLTLLNPATVLRLAAEVGLDTFVLTRNLTYRRQRYSLVCSYRQ